MRVLQDVRESSLKYSGQSAAKTRSMFAQFIAPSTSLHADQLDLLIFEELMEDSNRVRAAAHAGNDGCRQPAFSLQNLRAGFAANHGMKIAHHGGIRMSAQYAAQQIMRVADVCYPIAHCFVDRIFQRA